jgi:hypothetical protein
MISTDTFPTRLKFSEIKPVFKKGDKSNLSNYRPISMPPSFSIIFEEVILNRLTCHMDSNCISVKEQFGFRKGSSMELASYNLINNIQSALNNKLLIGGVFGPTKSI